MTATAKSGKERLREIVQRQSKNKQIKTIDWVERKQTWLEQINLLFQIIEQWLDNFESIKIQRQEVWITEEYIGKYQTERLLLYVGDILISFTPHGTLVMAAKGRVDIHASNNRRAMIVLEKEGERPGVVSFTYPDSSETDTNTIQYEWLIVKEKPTKDMPVLNEDTFSDLIADLIE